MALDYHGVVTVSVAKQIAENIRQAIVDGKIQIGERLPTEEELARSYKVSRPTVREALKRLAAQHLIHSRRGPSGGNFVTRPDPNLAAGTVTSLATLLVGLGAFELDEIIAARRETESLCARLAAEGRTDTDLAGMAAEIAIQQDSRISDEAFCESDVRFHRGLVDTTRNGPLRFMMHILVEAMMPVTNFLSFRERERRVVVTFHIALWEALRDHDEAAAVSAIQGLMDYLRDRCTEASLHLAARHQVKAVVVDQRE